MERTDDKMLMFNYLDDIGRKVHIYMSDLNACEVERIG